MGTVLKINPTDSRLRELMLDLDDAYDILNAKQDELLRLQHATFKIEASFHDQLQRYANAVGKDNVPKEFLDYGYLS